MWLRLAFIAIWILICGFIAWKYLRKMWTQGKKEEEQAAAQEDMADVRGKVVELKRRHRKYEVIKDVNAKEVQREQKKINEVLDL